MSFDKIKIKDRIKDNEEKLEKLESAGEDILKNKEFDLMQLKSVEEAIARMSDESVKNELERSLERGHDELERNYENRFERDVENPSKEIQDELDKEADESLRKSGEEIDAYKDVDRKDIEHYLKQELLKGIQESSDGYSDLASEARRIENTNRQRIENIRRRIAQTNN